MIFSNPTHFPYIFISVIIAFVIHEYSHAIIAYLLGDTTQKKRGRLTLKPHIHLTPVGVIFFTLFGVGWAKPVEINLNYLGHPKRDEAIIAFAGPASNFILAFFSTFLLITLGQRSNLLLLLFQYLVFLNLSLGIFNLFPFPPLDGAHILFSIISLPFNNNTGRYYQEKRVIFLYGSRIFILLIILNLILPIDLLPINKIANFIFNKFYLFWVQIV